jgi:5-methylcytosine-specific restriction protein A
MPVFPCKHPTCNAYVGRRGGYCESHEAEGKTARRERDRYYDRHLRSPDAKRFYNSAAWKHLRGRKLARDPVCERCKQAWAQHVHHTIPLEQCTPEQAMDIKLLKSLCQPCHNSEESEVRKCS